MLADLPAELLANITTHVERAQDLRNFSRTCRQLNSFVREEGWKIFARSRFPSFPRVDQSAHHIVHSLTTLSRNFDRKAIVARNLEPSGSIMSLNTREQLATWKKPRGQTIGYLPCLDSYEKFNGGDIHGRREILAWSAGSDLVVRAKETGPAVEALYDSCSPADRHTYFDQYHHKTDWHVFKIPGSIEGRDDITCIQILRPWQRKFSPNFGRYVEPIVVGTADGELNLLHLNLDVVPSWRRYIYNTSNRIVRAISTSPSPRPLLAAALGRSDLALYPVYPGNNHDTSGVEPVSEFDLLPDDGTEQLPRIWSARFLSHESLLVGVGPSKEPIQLCAITPTGFASEPIRKFSIGASISDLISSNPDSKMSSAYSLSGLPSASDPERDDPNLFLSGWYDGVVRLHDVRSPSTHVSSYWDTSEDGAVYSILPKARERLVVGGSKHCMLKFYDLRVSGGRAYRFSDNGGGTTAETGESLDASYEDSGWNVFLNSRNDSCSRRDRILDSPVYSLTSPSAHSPSIFAGLEDHAVQVDLTSIHDPHPDPMFQHCLVRTGKKRMVNIKKSWNPRGDVSSVAGYEQSDLLLNVQSGVGLHQGTLPGWDERWMSSKDPKASNSQQNAPARRHAHRHRRPNGGAER
ncbi:hypothetical protein HDK90DRAFT_411656 [Phyllosticta capitalensis]|uniref:F-box domain-containing protein n=2 Tax=Phyllosticta capitalensis TaxID=121624 RepID=A0ABR1YT01_9PEZI